MTTNTPKVTAHMVSSVDGFIAKADGSVSWLETSDTYEKGVTGESVEEFLKTIDCIRYPVSKGCTSPFAPIWIKEMVSRQG